MARGERRVTSDKGSDGSDEPPARPRRDIAAASSVNDIMRLIVGVLVLVVTGLDVRFGQAGTAAWIAGLVTGVLLALSALVDLIFPERSKSDEATRDATGD